MILVTLTYCAWLKGDEIAIHLLVTNTEQVFKGKMMDDIGIWIAIVGVLLILAGSTWHVNQRSERARRKAIRAKMPEWGAATCRTILMKKIRIGLTAEQVELSWGEPHTVDQQVVTEHSVQKQRWVYGKPESHEKHVYFMNGIVTKWRS
jgi:hypothetical protein